MNLTDINTQIIFTTIPIWIEKNDGATATGTAFFFQKKIDADRIIPFIITNEHIVNNAKSAVFSLIGKKNNEPTLQETIKVELSGDILTKHVDKENDLAVIPVGPILNELAKLGKEIFYRSIGEDLIPNSKIIEELSAVEEIYFIGYPFGMIDQVNNLPIVRKGISATPIWNDYNGKKVFIIDAGVYPGSSGSPVFIINNGAYQTKGGLHIGNRVIFIGVISNTYHGIESNNKVYLGLGTVIKTEVLSNLIDSVVKNIQI